ncbi:IPT/TIG domain-containing protein [Candidatus Saccharibacteria bacterium]|nr:IPT/TIG domain-containing protein [Candidatus Saccharibacteria bacterium]
MFYRRSGDGKKALKRKWKQLGMQRSNVRWRILSTGLGVFSLAFLGAFLASSILAPIQESSAVNTSEDSTAKGYSLSLSAAPSIDLNLSVVDETDMMTVAETDVTASTTAPNGYKLYVSMNDTSNALKLSGGSATIASTTGTLASPAELNSGEWGFAIPSGQISETNHFDASYVAFENGYSVSQFAGIPASGTNPATLINATSTPNTTTDEFQVYYGLKAKSDTATVGTYTNSVLWTAVADAATTPSASVSPATGKPDGGETITIETTLFTTSAIDANIYMRQGNVSTQMTCNRTSYAPLTYTCTTPAKAAGNYEVYVDVPKYEKNYTVAFEYKVSDITGITYMREMTADICANTAIGTSKALIDDRGSTPYKSYTVKKLNMNNGTSTYGACWMVDNLALVGSFTPTSSDTDHPASGFTLTASNTGTWCTSDSDACDNQSMVINTGSTYGVLYNWYAATAGTGTRSTGANVDASGSICPKGWVLPKGGSSGDFQYLYNAYNSYANMVTNTSGPKFVLAGDRYGGSTYNQGTYGYYWSRTAYSSSYAYDLYLSSSNSTVYPASGYYKYYGFSVRCIAEQ